MHQTETFLPAGSDVLPPSSAPCVHSCVGPCLLGGLQPRMLLVSTPNWEYNAVLRGAEVAGKMDTEEGGKAQGGGGGTGSWPGPPGRDGLPLRCNDHRCVCASWACMLHAQICCMFLRVEGETEHLTWAKPFRLYRMCWKSPQRALV